MRSPSIATIKRLFSVSGNTCAFPECDMTLVSTASDKVIGQICHIKAKRPGEARYDLRLSSKELHGFGNLILLCPTHHKIIDTDENTYTVERMLRMKAVHEEKHANSSIPSDQVVNALRRADSQLRLVEVRLPPDEILELLKRRHVRRLSRTSKLMLATSIFYLAWFGFDIWFMSSQGLGDWSPLDLLPSPAFLLLTVGFAHWSFVYHKRKVIAESEPQLMSKKRHHVRDVTLKADYEWMVDKCAEALRMTGAKILEVVREDADHTIIGALRMSGSFWRRFTPRGLSLDEIVVAITRQEEGKCLIRVETSVDDKSEGSIFYTTQFLEKLTKRD